MTLDEYYLSALQTVCCQGIEDVYLDQAIDDWARRQAGLTSDDVWESYPEVHFCHSPYRPAH